VIIAAVAEDWPSWTMLDVSKGEHPNGTLLFRSHGRLRLSLNLFL